MRLQKVRFKICCKGNVSRYGKVVCHIPEKQIAALCDCNKHMPVTQIQKRPVLLKTRTTPIERPQPKPNGSQTIVRTLPLIRICANFHPEPCHIERLGRIIDPADLFL